MTHDKLNDNEFARLMIRVIPHFQLIEEAIPHMTMLRQTIPLLQRHWPEMERGLAWADQAPEEFRVVAMRGVFAEMERKHGGSAALWGALAGETRKLMSQNGMEVKATPVVEAPRVKPAPEAVVVKVEAETLTGPRGGIVPTRAKQDPVYDETLRHIDAALETLDFPNWRALSAALEGFDIRLHETVAKPMFDRKLRGEYERGMRGRVGTNRMINVLTALELLVGERKAS